MRKEWLHWIVGREKSSRRRERDKMEEAATSAGCMCAVFQLFDLHPLNQHQHHYSPSSSYLQEEEEEAVTTPKGVEAPRNSLEMEEPVAKEVGLKSLAMKEEENLNFPVGMNIKTGNEKISSPRISTNSSFSKSTKADEISPSETETKTPTLLARLMGLDLLPSESNSPSFSNSKPQKTPQRLNYQRKDRNILQTRSSKAFSDDDISIGARSLPETPRISSARRSDVEYFHHRLSLQVNKEICNEEFGVSSGKIRRGKFKVEDENRGSPRHYAKQIVKQVKASLSRRVGLMDITNTIDNNKLELKSTRRDENLILLKPTKKIYSLNGELSSDGTPSCSPRLRFLETNKPKQIPTKSPGNPVPFSDKNPSKQKSQVITPLQENQTISRKLPPKVSDQAIRNKKESFVRSNVTNKESLTETKAKKASLSMEILSISGPTLLPVKKCPSPPATKLPQKQSQVSDAVSSKRRSPLSCNPVHPYQQQQLPPEQIFAGPEKVLTVNTNSCATAPPAGAAAEYESYIKRILQRVGITDRATPITVAKLHAPSHSLDPSIFHYLELFHPFLAAAGGGGGENSILSRRSNRKLIFQLVDELLAEILRPNLDFKPWVSPFTANHHLPLVDELCNQILRFPAANCQVLEDIDALVDADFRKFKANGLMLEDELECVVCDIEGQIVESLLLETVAVVGGCTAEEQRHGLTDVTWEPVT